MPDTASRHAQLTRNLTEREKELDALYKLASLFSRPIDTVQTAIQETASILHVAMEHADRTRVSISTDEIEKTAGVESAPSQVVPVDQFACRRRYSIEREIIVSVSLFEGFGAADRHARIGEREKHLITSTTDMVANLLQRREMDQILRESTKTLQRQAAELERKNVALSEVLSRIDENRHASLRSARNHIDTFVVPYLREIAERIPSHSLVQSRIEQIERSLYALFDGNSQTLLEAAHRLTPREAQICGLIRNGLTTKEISSFLYITETTVERHRNTIRRKLDLNNSSINLTTFLRSSV